MRGQSETLYTLKVGLAYLTLKGNKSVIAKIANITWSTSTLSLEYLCPSILEQHSVVCLIYLQRSGKIQDQPQKSTQFASLINTMKGLDNCRTFKPSYRSSALENKQGQRGGLRNTNHKVYFVFPSRFLTDDKAREEQLEK